MTDRFIDFAAAIDHCRIRLLNGSEVHTEKWQGYEIAQHKHMKMQEVLNVSFSVFLNEESVSNLVTDVQPNMPWAEDHFQERVAGQPLNPGVQWQNWPWAKAAADSIVHLGKFSHTYMERYWPKFVGSFPRGVIPSDVVLSKMNPIHGLWFPLGDLSDVVRLLADQPLTRQAYLPVWFPEDTGAVHGGRLPCSLGYHFIMRDGQFHIVYYIRSCDYLRHFRDDIYLTVRLMQWVKKKAAGLNEAWSDVALGTFTMHITSLHCFVADLPRIKNEN